MGLFGYDVGAFWIRSWGFLDAILDLFEYDLGAFWIRSWGFLHTIFGALWIRSWGFLDTILGLSGYFLDTRKCARAAALAVK